MQCPMKGRLFKALVAVKNRLICSGYTTVPVLPTIMSNQNATAAH